MEQELFSLDEVKSGLKSFFSGLINNAKKEKKDVEEVKKLEERKQKSKILYDKLSLITAFCNQLPELFKIAEPQVKREIIQTCVRTLSYNGETLKIELFPLFNNLKSLKNVKYGAGGGIRTHAYRNHNPRS